MRIWGSSENTVCFLSSPVCISNRMGKLHPFLLAPRYLFSPFCFNIFFLPRLQARKAIPLIILHILYLAISSMWRAEVFSTELWETRPGRSWGDLKSPCPTFRGFHNSEAHLVPLPRKKSFCFHH